MSAPRPSGWQEIRDEVRRRIHARDWRPGEAIPNEVALAEEFGCARATVNRALRELAASGLLDRRRKGGTRVALHPVRRAVLDIPVIRQEVEAAGADYGYRLLRRSIEPPDEATARLMQRTGPLLRIAALHHAGETPWAAEYRWIDPDLPGLDAAPFDRVSPNEWLLEHVPYTDGRIAFFARVATRDEGRDLSLAPGAAVLVIERTTRDGERTVTTVSLVYPAGHRLTAQL